MSGPQICSQLRSWAAAILCGLPLLSLPAFGQNTREAEFQAYRLQHAQPTEVASKLRTLLADVAGDSEILVDRRSNRLLLQGPPEAHRLAGQLVTALDREALNSQNNARQAPVVHGYPVAPERLQDVAGQLQKRYPASSGVRITADQRTGQVLVVATPEVHREVAELLGQQSPIGAAANAFTPARSRSPHRLQFITAQELEQALQHIWGNQVTIEDQANGAYILLPGGDATMLLDRQRGEVRLEGSETAVFAWQRVLDALDLPPAQRGQRTRIVQLQRAAPSKVQQAVNLIRAAAVQQLPSAAALPAAAWGGHLASMIFQPEPVAAQQQPAQNQPPAAQPGQPDAPPDQNQTEQVLVPGGGPLSDVQVEILPGGVLVIRGREQDVQRVMELIRQIEARAVETQPEIEVFPLQHVDSEALAAMINSIYEEVYAPLQGAVSVTALGVPNALLLIGSRERLDIVKNLATSLDQPVPPATQIRVFRLRHAPATEAEQTIVNFFGAQAQTQAATGQPANQAQATPTLQVRVRVIADYRSNSLIVQASPRDMERVELLIQNLDVRDTAAASEVRVFRLKNTLAEDLQPVLQAAVSGQVAPGTGQPGAAPGAQPGAANRTPTSTKLQIIGVDSVGNKIIDSGILYDVTIAADANLNALVVRAPSNSMDLIGELIRQLDQLPAAEAQIKVFEIRNGDATSLAGMLQQLFGQPITAGQNAVGQAFGRALGQALAGGPLGATAGGETSLIPIRFAVDQRTNSIIASGSEQDLLVVEAILVRLDETDLRQRRVGVFRLNNVRADFVANALSQLLAQERQILNVQQQQFFLLTPYEQVEQQIFVVPETYTNSLIISASPRYFDRIVEVIQELDERPPMIMIQVVIAEVTLDHVQEFGMELGLQDSLMFDRGMNSIGYNFVGGPLPNDLTAAARASRETLGGQAFSAFNVGRTSATSGFPGLVLSASNESVQFLLRALEAKQRMQVLGRPQIMTLNNVPASILVGQRVPRITDTTVTVNGTTSSVTLDEVGLRLGIIPRVTTDGLIVMDLEATRSSVGPVESGIPVAVQDGVAIRSPILSDTTAITTIAARSGQTVVFAGLINKEKAVTRRGVPFLTDIPILGRLFRFDAERELRNELLIFLTPHIVHPGDEADYDWLKATESERMSWCLADVVEIHGDVGLQGGPGPWGPREAPVIFPDLNPAATEPVATPAPDAGAPAVPTPPRVNSSPEPPLVPPDSSSRRQPLNQQAASQMPVNGQPYPGYPEVAPAEYAPAEAPPAQREAVRLPAAPR